MSLLNPDLYQVNEGILVFGRIPQWAIVIDFTTLPEGSSSYAWTLGMAFSRSIRTIMMCSPTPLEIEFAIEHLEVLCDVERKIIELAGR